MILHKLTLFNFRQFKGVQEIEFANPSAKEATNISIFFGENGRGKTGIFRAIVFCLFGVRRLSQDGDVPDSELQLVNTNVLEVSQGNRIEAFVELAFSHKGVSYILKRSISGLLKDERIHEEIGGIRLVSTSAEGNSEVIDKADIDLLITSIIDPRVKDYFFFDGETMDRLTRASIEQRREIAKGIRNLLDVDALETAIKATDRLTRALEIEIRKHATPDLARLLQKLQENEEKEKDKRLRLDTIANELQNANSQKRDIDKKLEAIKEIRHLIEDREKQERILGDLKDDAKERLSDMKKFSAKMALQLIGSTLENVYQQIDDQKKRGDIPSEIRKDLVEKILKENWCCVCDRSVPPGSDAEKKVIEWLNKTTDVIVQESALDLWRYLSEVLSRFPDDGNQVENVLLSYGNLRNKIDNVRNILEKIKKQIGDENFENVLEWEKQRESYKAKILKLEAEDISITQNINALVEERRLLLEHIDKEKRNQDKGTELIKRATLARKSAEALKEVHDGFTNEIKDLISEKATFFMGQFMDAEGKETLRKIVVKDDYSLQVMDRWGRPFLANISVGQRQVMSIAFIVALAQVASQDQLLEMPLFMDTPLGRLSQDHRKNLIMNLPSFSSQWILLATDTEFTKFEARLFRNSKKWGKFYNLRPDGEGNTKIENISIDNSFAILKDEGEKE